MAAQSELKERNNYATRLESGWVDAGHLRTEMDADRAALSDDLKGLLEALGYKVVTQAEFDGAGETPSEPPSETNLQKATKILAAATVINPESYVKIDNSMIFRMALVAAIGAQIRTHPGRFSRIVKDDPEFPSKFAHHMIQKFKEGKTLVLNETVATAMQTTEQQTGVRLREIDQIYKFLGFQLPEDAIVEEAERQKEPPAFRGC